MMNTIPSHAFVAALAVAILGSAPAAEAADPIRVMVVHGGHEFETNQFLKMIRGIQGIAVDVVGHPKAHERLAAGVSTNWDVLVLYDLWQEITNAACADFTARLKEGKGLVALHHALGNYQAWPEYERIVGGKFHLQKRVVDGAEKPASTYKHDVEIPVKIANPEHPVTRGISDFTLHDETYGGFDVSPQAHALLTTTEPTSSRTIGWAKTYEAARVVYLQLGHDHLAYENTNYCRLLSNAIRWVSRAE